MAKLVSVRVGKYSTGEIRVPEMPKVLTESDLKSYVDQRVLRSGTATTLCSGTQAEYDALPAATREASGFIAVIV